MENNKLLLIDGENLLHRSFHKFENLKASDGKPSGAIFGFFKSLNYLVFRFKPSNLFITFDNGHSTYRTNICPNYKSHRKNISRDYESLQNQKRVIMRILKNMGIPYIFDKYKECNYEGDDYIALLEHIYHDDVLIVSSDKDFCQLINNRVKVFNPSKNDGVLINTKNCKEIMGYSPLECVDYLILVGDNSDDIKGYPGIGPKKARKFLDDWNNIHYFLMNTNNTFPGIDYDLLNEVYNRNNKMINLYLFLKDNPITNIPIVYGKYNKDRLNRIFKRYSLTSFRSKEFLETFKSLKIWKVKNK